ncbi:MAG: hypothetical protein ABSG53_26165, partial [Thermoguttaceae bacterium]
MILGAAACVSEVTQQAVQAALAAVKVRDVRDWIKQHLGISVQGQRLHAFKAIPTGTKAG